MFFVWVLYPEEWKTELEDTRVVGFPGLKIIVYYAPREETGHFLSSTVNLLNEL